MLKFSDENYLIYGLLQYIEYPNKNALSVVWVRGIEKVKLKFHVRLTMLIIS